MANKFKNYAFRNRANTKITNDVRRESLMQNISNNLSMDKNLEPKPQIQINSIQSFVVSTNKSRNSSLNANSSTLNINENNRSLNKAPDSNPDFKEDTDMIIEDENTLVKNQTNLINGNHREKESNNFINFKINPSNHGINFTKPSNNTFNFLDISEQKIVNPRPLLVEEYIDDIFQHLKEIEFNFVINSTYMKKQNDINEKMRGILIDWIVEVHLKFKLTSETLFLTVNLIDRYLDLKIIMRNKLQLVGVTAMLIACKYEEIYAPEVKDFVYITDKAYTKDEIFQMENEMLSTLEYNITVPSSYRYMEVFNQYLKIEDNALMFCRYLLELFLVEYKMIKYNPSLLAAASIYLTLKITGKNLTYKIVELSNYTDEVLKECAKDICIILDNVEKCQLQAVRKKFSLPKFMEVAKIRFN